MAATRIATSYRQERRLLRSRWMWLWAAVLVAFLAYLPDVLATSSVFGISLTPTERLGIGLPNLNITMIVMIGADFALNADSPSVGGSSDPGSEPDFAGDSGRRAKYRKPRSTAMSAQR